jgi:RNA polymerase sigma factor (sigma-70 family)
MPKRSSNNTPCSPRCAAVNEEIRDDVKDPPLAPEHFFCVWCGFERRAQNRARRMNSLLASFSMDHEDMSQQIALALWEAITEGRVRAARGFLEVWYAHAYGSVLRYQRRRPALGSGQESLDDTSLSPVVFGAGEANPEDMVSKNEMHQFLAGLCVKLPEGMRAALELSLEGQTAPEIAKALGTTPGAVRLRLMHARDRLREMFLEAA